MLDIVNYRSCSVSLTVHRTLFSALREPVKSCLNQVSQSLAGGEQSEQVSSRW